MQPDTAKKPIYRSLYFWVLVAIATGVVIGHFFPHTGERLKPLGDVFIRLIKMVIAPIIFTTVVVGLAGAGDVKKVGRVGLKAMLYFEAASTVALVLGLVVVNLVRPGAGIHAQLSAADAATAAAVAGGAGAHGGAAAGHEPGAWGFINALIPNNIVDAIARGDILQILFFSVLFGVALAAYGPRGRPLVELLDHASHAFFGVVAIVMRVAPLGALGAMAFTVGKYKISALASLGKLMGCFYATCALFIFFVLGAVARACGVSILKFLKYIRDEVVIVLGTSSSESVLPRMMRKLEALGCSKSVVGLVIPTGYSFNLDGTSIYLTMAVVFIAQATDVPLPLDKQLGLLAVLLLTSKGAAGVTGSGFVTLAATLASVRTVPVAGLALILGIDRFMSEARAITNLIGNGVATLVVARWEREFDRERARRVLDGEEKVELT